MKRSLIYRLILSLPLVLLITKANAQSEQSYNSSGDCGLNAGSSLLPDIAKGCGYQEDDYLGDTLNIKTDSYSFLVGVFSNFEQRALDTRIGSYVSRLDRLSN